MNEEKDKKARREPPRWLRDFLGNNKNMYWCMFIAVGLLLVTIYGARADPSKNYPIMEYPEFIERLEAHEVDQVVYSRNAEYMTVALFNDDTRDMDPEGRAEYRYPEKELWRVKYPAGDGFRARLLENGATATQYTPFSLADTVFGLVSTLLTVFLVVMVFLMLKNGPMGMLVNSSKSLLRTSDVRFKDVIGQDEVIDDLKFIVDLMKDPDIGKDIGAKVPKGLLLQGPPGTGKTMLAKAVAGEAGVPFIQQSASAFIEMYVGMGAKRVRELFALARKSAPCIVFIDEIDAVGGKRDKAGSTSENDQTINALLEQMDGFNAREGVFIIAATNRPGELDEALIRPGRFDRQVTVNPPQDYRVRTLMFRHYLDGLKISEDVDIDSVARQTPGFTGADIAAICNEAGIIAAMAGKPAVDHASIEEAIDKKVFMGNRSRKEKYQKDKQVVAWHEAGHAVMTWLLGEGISRAGIQGTTSGVGGAVFGEDRESQLMTEQDYVKQVKILYAGRASEEIKFRTPSTGASNDITKATQMLTQYVERLGFDQELGLLDLSLLSKDHLLSAGTTVQSISRLSKKIYAETKCALEDSYYLVDALAERLLFEESLSGKQIDGMFRKLTKEHAKKAVKAGQEEQHGET